MKPVYEYHRPDNIDQACRLLADLQDARVLAGGTDLLFDIDTGLRRARHVISLKNVLELKEIRDEGKQISIGAGCTAREVQASSLISAHLPELTEMVVTFASPQIRSRATLAGNICSAVPCGDFPVILIALGAQLELVSAGDSRTVTLSGFFTGPRETVREPGELLTRILVSKKESGSGACHQKFQRRASNSLAVASVAAFLSLRGGLCHEARIVLGAVGPTPLLAESAGSSLVGQTVETETIDHAAELAREEARPITDVRASAEFRRELVCVLTRRALRRAADRAQLTS